MGEGKKGNRDRESDRDGGRWDFVGEIIVTHLLDSEM